MKLIFIFLFFILFISQVSALGVLETPRIGLNLNLTERDSIETIIKVFNPTNETINVTLIPQEFINLKTDKVVEISVFLLPKNYLLKPNQTQESKIILTPKNSGEYEGIISVVFKKSNSEQKTTLNSVIQINVFNDKEGLSQQIIILIVILGIISVLVVGVCHCSEECKEAWE